MSQQDVRVTNLPSDKSHYDVAFEMAQTIARIEKKATSETVREYFLELYYQCHRVVYRGDKAAEALGKTARATSGSW